ncbi:SusC/RagA family TonB-linked outer membrane protein [Mucilaginibacter sp. X5P1]|uniref:SusC/RagA family TonB-linked outer membrane protein n=1 Tax=Mucilaginibacter sp. X5P1 TaxID=2723088 RepID=UPI00161D9197|nr:TonB-dependent receptor [Mucilaginibacter sp. X5P1]MBB6140162.1 TonB-linked SusC/RagA family outer membrane protein [Mucilaginibacter sp. X5P1]
MSKFYQKEFYLTCLLLLFAVFGFAQVKVTGVVKGADNDESLPGASVSVKGTSVGSMTDANGKYSITVPKDGVLTFSFIGYTTQEINVDGKTVINVTLPSSAKGLNEVVVVGYGTQKKVNLTGAVSVVSAAQLENRPVTGVTNALEGTVPGVTISSNNGQPGFDAGSINIRGQSLNSTSALVVIDGVISTTGDMNAINADDIDNISILKDAASASIYGNRAAGGVIVITTKKGKKGTAQITYSDYFGKNKAVALPDYLPSWQAATLYDEARVNEGQTPVYTAAQIQTFKDGSDPYNYPNTDWLKLFYSGSGFQQNHYLGVNGGSDKTTYALSIGYFDEDGITPKTNTQRYTARLNLNTQIKDNLSVFGYLSYAYQPLTQPQSSLSADQGFDQVIRQFNRISPIIPAYYANGEYGHIADGSPLAWLNSPSFDKQNAYNFQGSVGGDWEIIKGLHFKPSLNYKFNTNQSDNFVSAIQYYNADGSLSGTPNISNATDSYSSHTYIAPQALLEYDKKLGNHDIKILAGASQEYNSYYTLTGYRQGFLNNSLSDLNVAPTTGQTTSNDTYDVAQRSFFGRVNYDYKGKYLLEGDIRDDGSSRFAPANRWGVFPGASAGWRISEEDFFKNLKNSISNLKLRASWGKLGNQDIAGYYPTIATVSAGQNYPYGGTVVGGVAPTAGVDPSIVWEKTTQTDLGLDADFLKVFTLTADYFIKKTSDVLYQVSLPAPYGLTAPYVNGSSYQNKGWELALSYHDRAGDFSWNVTGNASFIANKVTQLGTSNAPQISGAYITEVGQPQGSFYGYVSQGIFQNEAQVKAHADQSGISPNTGPGDLIYKDVNGDGKIDANDRVVLGSNFPKVTFGLNLNANWKQFDFTAFFQGAAGVKNYITGIALGQNGIATGKPTSAMLDSWSPTNTNATFPRLWLNYTQDNPSNVTSSFWVRNASYVRLKNVQLGYSLPVAWATKIGVKKLRVYYSGQNILTFTSFYKWIDPEAPAGESGYDFPQVKINSLGLNVTF